ncbi:hypothetical protein [Corynebacterium glutamicum]|uniref:Uncharacterized protein n=2 Tax=Corynebacterium glutamicum TaxID=1718 RepID=Q5KRF1_CORGT|nr:hypothetical protein [Corynebacterium glutamicum]BAD84103.1 hypothetical protein [Corynebacterium glutamicum]BAF54895.1 hypothetical protein cgR_1900 [Corynebacterium glutamicum R]
MTDIIARAKELAKNGHTKGPWRASLFNGFRNDDGSSNFEGGIYPEDYGSPPIFLTSSGIDEHDAHVIAFAAEAVESLAEEKYVWSVQVLMSGRWIFMVTLNTGNSLEEAAKWFPTKKRAEYFASLWEPDTPARVVKRRVSPVIVDG